MKWEYRQSMFNDTIIFCFKNTNKNMLTGVVVSSHKDSIREPVGHWEDCWFEDAFHPHTKPITIKMFNASKINYNYV